jgi:hypothetical protein
VRHAGGLGRKKQDKQKPKERTPRKQANVCEERRRRWNDMGAGDVTIQHRLQLRIDRGLRRGGRARAKERGCGGYSCAETKENEEDMREGVE